MPIFATAPPFMKLGPDAILMFIYPLYVLVESVLHCFSAIIATTGNASVYENLHMITYFCILLPTMLI